MKWRGLKSSRVSVSGKKWRDVILIHLMKQVCMKGGSKKPPAFIGDGSVSGDLPLWPW